MGISTPRLSTSTADDSLRRTAFLDQLRTDLFGVIVGVVEILFLVILDKTPLLIAALLHTGKARPTSRDGLETPGAEWFERTPQDFGGSFGKLAPPVGIEVVG